MKPGMGWPIGIAAVLGATVAANIAFMRVAANDPSMAIEPDYYKKAVAFDSTMSLERASNALGWTAVSTIEPGASGKAARVRVRLAAADGTPIAGATVRVVAMFNARANDLQSSALQMDPDSSYSAPLDIRFPGEWEVRVDAVRDRAHFIATSRVTVALATPGGRLP